MNLNYYINLVLSNIYNCLHECIQGNVRPCVSLICARFELHRNLRSTEANGWWKSDYVLSNYSKNQSKS